MGKAAASVRDHWSGRAAFVLAAIGSAVGLGNLWGFPYKLYTYGGGAFLIPYFVAMLVIGIPLLIMEFSVGHWAQNSPPGAFAKVLKRYKFVGWWLVLLAFMIITYYTVVLSYCVNYLWESILGLASGNLAWSGGAEKAGAHFGELNGKDADLPTYGISGFQWSVLIGNLISWGLVYLCLFRGVKWVSKVVLVTVPLPWLMLVVLTIRGLTLEGAIDGLEFYLEPRWHKLADPATWRFAFGQVFFSMSLGFAVMLSYASFLHRRSDLNNNAMIIGLGDLATSFIAGVAVFATIGGMSLATGLSVDQAAGEGGAGLAFVTFPYALSKLPAAAIFATVFFVALLTLGIDSAFSIVEACLASVCDIGERFKRAVVLPIICFVGFSIGTIYTLGNAGVNVLTLADALINGPFGILLVAIAECVVVGWAWRGRFVLQMRQHANDRSDWTLHAWWDWVIRYIAPAMLAILFVWSISGEVHKEIYKQRMAPRYAEVEAKLEPLKSRFQSLKKNVAQPQLAKISELKQRIKEADAENKLHVMRDLRLEIREVEQTIEDRVAVVVQQRDLAVERKKFESLSEELAELDAKEVAAKYTFPWPLLIGSLIFIAIPIIGAVVSLARPVDPEQRERSGVWAGVVYVAIVMVISGVIIETANANGLLGAAGGKFKPDQTLSLTAYAILAAFFLVIFGGLAWCFWRAVQAAGGGDTEIEDQPSI